MDGVVNARNVLIVGRSAAGSLPCPGNQGTGPAGVTLASWPTASVMLRHTAATL